MNFVSKSVFFSKKVKTVDEDWSIGSLMSVPSDFFRVVKAKGGSLAFLDIFGEVCLADKVFTQNQNPDRFELSLHICKILFQLECEEIPISEKQLGYFTGLETIEKF